MNNKTQAIKELCKRLTALSQKVEAALFAMKALAANCQTQADILAELQQAIASEGAEADRLLRGGE